MPVSFYLVAVAARCAPDQLQQLGLPGEWQGSPDWHWQSVHALQIRPARLQARLATLCGADGEALLVGLLPGEAWELSVFAAGTCQGPLRHDWQDPGRPAAEGLLAALARLQRFASLPQELPRLLMPGGRKPWANALLGDLPAVLQLLGLGGIFTGFEALQRQEREQQRWEAHCHLLAAEGSGAWVQQATQGLEPQPLAGTVTLSPADLSLVWRLAWFSDPENCPLLELSGPVSDNHLRELQRDWPAEDACRWLAPVAQTGRLAWAAGELGQDLLPAVDRALDLLARRLAQLGGDWSLSLRCAPVPRLYHELDARPEPESLQLYRFSLRAGQLSLDASWPALSAANLSLALDLARWAREGGSWQAPRRDEALRLYRRLRQDRWLSRDALRLRGRELSLRPGSLAPYCNRHQLARQIFLACAGAAWPLEAERSRQRSLDLAWRGTAPEDLHSGRRLYRGGSGDFYAGQPEALSPEARQALRQRSEALEARGWNELGELVWDQAETVLMRVFQDPEGLAWGFLLAEPEGLRHELASPLNPEASHWLVSCDRAGLSPDECPAGLQLQCLPGADDERLWQAHRQALPPSPIHLPPADLDDFLPILDAFLQRISPE